jgi:hypothetical protein
MYRPCTYAMSHKLTEYDAVSSSSIVGQRCDTCINRQLGKLRIGMSPIRVYCEYGKSNGYTCHE